MHNHPKKSTTETNCIANTLHVPKRCNKQDKCASSTVTLSKCSVGRGLRGCQGKATPSQLWKKHDWFFRLLSHQVATDNLLDTHRADVCRGQQWNWKKEAAAGFARCHSGDSLCVHFRIKQILDFVSLCLLLKSH